MSWVKWGAYCAGLAMCPVLWWFSIGLMFPDDNCVDAWYCHASGLGEALFVGVPIVFVGFVVAGVVTLVRTLWRTQTPRVQISLQSVRDGRDRG